MIDTPHVFDEIHVISDLHLGGPPGFQIFRETAALVAYIERLTAGNSYPCCLVINGDFIDFLAESPARHFDPLGAVAKLDRLVADKSFAPIFVALQDFLGAEANHLAITLGNHDVELALPWVRARLLEALSGGDPVKRGRIILSLAGEGLLLRVGGPQGPKVLCLHGNEADAWNVVEHEEVRRVARDGQRGQRIDEDWIPNAGSRMVIEVMNELKGEFAFVDLLKPEAGAVAPILAALKPGALGKLRSIASAAARRTFDDVRMRFGWLGDQPGGGPPGAAARGRVGAAPPMQLVGVRARREAADLMAGELLDQAERRLAEEREDPIDLIGADLRQEYLGLWGAGLNLLRGKPVQALREALEGLDQDRSFTYLDPDPTYRELHKMVSTNIDFLVAGHTHLARAIEREGTRAYYYNTGTWARVFRLDDKVRNSPDDFEALCRALNTPSIDALDKTPGLIAVRPHVAVIWREGAQVIGELRTVAALPPHAADPVAHTRFVRS